MYLTEHVFPQNPHSNIKKFFWDNWKLNKNLVSKEITISHFSLSFMGDKSEEYFKKRKVIQTRLRKL